MKIKIRTEGNSKLGYGHLQRTYAIAEYIIKHSDHQIIYYTQNSDSNFFDNKPVEQIQIEKENEFLDSIGPEEIIIVDGYQWNISFFRSVKEKCHKLVVIDDLADRELIADILINHSADSTIDYSKSNINQCLLGPRYALLSAPFTQNYNNGLRDEDSILVCFGGSDPLNLTAKLWSTVASCFKKVDLVTGAGYRHRIDLKNNLAKCTNVNYEHNVSSTRMAELMEKSQFALLPSSSILFEALSRGLAVFSGYFIDNQQRIYAGFERERLIIGLGDLGDITLSYLRNQLLSRDSLQTNIVSREVLKSTFDGNSVQRIYNEIVK